MIWVCSKFTASKRAISRCILILHREGKMLSLGTWLWQHDKRLVGQDEQQASTFYQAAAVDPPRLRAVDTLLLELEYNQYSALLLRRPSV